MRNRKPRGPNREQIRRERVAAADTGETAIAPEGDRPAREETLTAPPIARNLLPRDDAENPVLTLLGSGYFWTALGTLAAIVVPAAIYFGRLDNRVDHIQDGVSKISEKVDRLNDGISAQGSRLGTLEYRIGVTETTIDGMRGSPQPKTAQPNVPQEK